MEISIVNYRGNSSDQVQREDQLRWASPRNKSYWPPSSVRLTAVYQAIVIGGLMGHMTRVKFFFESVFWVCFVCLVRVLLRFLRFNTGKKLNSYSFKHRLETLNVDHWPYTVVLNPEFLSVLWMIIVYFGLTPKSFLVGMTGAYSAKLGLFFVAFTVRWIHEEWNNTMSRTNGVEWRKMTAEILVFWIVLEYFRVAFLYQIPFAPRSSHSRFTLLKETKAGNRTLPWFCMSGCVELSWKYGLFPRF